MKVDRIVQAKEIFQEELQHCMLQQKTWEEGYKWDLIEQWQSSIDLESLDMSESFDQALSSTYSGRLWEGERHSIKSGMLQLMQAQPLYMQATLKDLFNENMDENMRFSRFQLHCDEVLAELHQKDERINDHRQTDYAASLYLALHIPERYALFDYEVFHKFMVFLESRNIPEEHDKERYYKAIRAIYKVLSKDTDFMNGVQYVLQKRNYTGPSLMLINDIMESVVKRQ